MNLLTILALTGVVFFTRYVFLEPTLPLRLPPKLQRLLSYSSPAILTAIWAPLVFAPEHQLQLTVNNPYLIAAIVTAVITAMTKRVLLAITAGTILFLLLHHF